MKHVTILFLSLALLVVAVGLTSAAQEMEADSQRSGTANSANGGLVSGRTPMPTAITTRTVTPTRTPTVMPTHTPAATPTVAPTVTPTATPWIVCYFSDVEPDATHSNPSACDDDVDVADVMRVARCWQAVVDTACPSMLDFNQTGIVDINDVITVAEQWGWPHH